MDEQKINSMADFEKRLARRRGISLAVQAGEVIEDPEKIAKELAKNGAYLSEATSAFYRYRQRMGWHTDTTTTPPDRA